MTDSTTLSRAAALAYIQRQRGCDTETAEAIVNTTPVAGRWNTGLGDLPFYYPRDLDVAAATQEQTT